MYLAEPQTEGQTSGNLISAKIVSGTGMFKDGDLVGNAFSQVCQSRSGPVRWKGLIDQFDPVPHGDGGACFQVDLAWRAVQAGHTVVEVPITFTEREIGESKMSGGVMTEAFLMVARWGLQSRLEKLGLRR